MSDLTQSSHADAFIAAMHAAGAVLRPIREKPGAIDLDGTFTIEIPDDQDTRLRVAAVEAEHPIQRSEAGHVCYALIMEEAGRRFEATVGDDLAAAVEELSRLDQVSRTAGPAETAVYETRPADDPLQASVALAADIACDDFYVAHEYVLAMPIRRLEDLAPKLAFAERFCEDDERAQVLSAIEAFKAEHTTSFAPDSITTHLVPPQPDADIAPILARCLAVAAATKGDDFEVVLQQLHDSTTRDLAITVGDDLAKALVAVDLTQKAMNIGCDAYETRTDLDKAITDRVGDLLVEVRIATLHYMLELPVRSIEDVGCMVELSLRHCDWHHDRVTVLFAIANFMIPETVATLPDISEINMY